MIASFLHYLAACHLISFQNITTSSNKMKTLKCRNLKKCSCKSKIKHFCKAHTNYKELFYNSDKKTKVKLHPLLTNF